MSEEGFLRPGHVTRRQATDTGMAATLVLLVVGLLTRERWPLQAASVVLVLSMAAPFAFRYPAVFWFGLARVLGAVSSRVVLSILFFALVVPVGLVRRLAGKDPLLLRGFRRGSASVFVIRNKRYSSTDLRDPF